jgi:hypothetical protein
MQIDPTKITNFQRTDAELQAFALFGLFCAGKNSDYAARCLARLLNKCDSTPFNYLRELGEIGIHNALVASKIGQYHRLTKALMALIELDLRTCSLSDLTSVFGIGAKTARFFLVHSRPNCDHAILDVHVLKFLRDNGVEDAPEQTPTNHKKYLELEKKFLYLAKIRFPFMSIADIDLIIWQHYSGRLHHDFLVNHLVEALEA